MNTGPARGMRDFLPEDVRRRHYVIGVIADVPTAFVVTPQAKWTCRIAACRSSSQAETSCGVVAGTPVRPSMVDSTPDQRW